MSLFIYAGSMQYVALGLLTAALTTLMVNVRHLFYGISMVDAYKGAGSKKTYMVFLKNSPGSFPVKAAGAQLFIP